MITLEERRQQIEMIRGLQHIELANARAEASAARKEAERGMSRFIGRSIAGVLGCIFFWAALQSWESYAPLYSFLGYSVLGTACLGAFVESLHENKPSW
jgi:hypothetical protein